MEVQSKLEEFVKHAKEYAETRADLIAINVQDKATEVISSLVASLVVGLLSLMVLIFLSVGVAWWLGQSLGEPSIGFFIIGGFYLLIVILAAVFKNQFIKLPIINSLLKKINFHEQD